MKKFPIVDFDFKAEDQARNLKLLVRTLVDFRKNDGRWADLKPLYAESKYAEYIGWGRLYKAACAAWNDGVPAKARTAPAPKTKVSGDAKAADPEPKPEKAKDIQLAEHFPKMLTADSYKLLKQLIINDLQSENSVILAEIADRLNLK